MKHSVLTFIAIALFIGCAPKFSEVDFLAYQEALNTKYQNFSESWKNRSIEAFVEQNPNIKFAEISEMGGGRKRHTFWHKEVYNPHNMRSERDPLVRRLRVHVSMLSNRDGRIYEITHTIKQY